MEHLIILLIYMYINFTQALDYKIETCVQYGIKLKRKATEMV